MTIQLRTGVMVIGSLYWESRDNGSACECKPNDVRKEWRNSRLSDDEADLHDVKVPIRYGRKSGKNRGCTYTMVVSPEYKSRLGVAKVIRCRNPVTMIGDLNAEAEALWNAESNGNGYDRVSSKCGWGRVAVMTPPKFLDDDKRDERETLLRLWGERVSRKGEPKYGDFNFSKKDKEAAEDESVIKKGRLRIPWPCLANDDPLPLDLLLVTLTDPTLEEDGSYPTADKIATAWNNNKEYLHYFRCNQLVGIKTADDDEIKKLLV